MSRGIVFVILSALLLLQVCCSQPVDDSDSKPSEPSKGDETTSTKAARLASNMFHDLNNLADTTLKNGGELFKKYIADAGEEKTDEQTKKIAEIVNKMEKLKTLSPPTYFQNKLALVAEIVDTLKEEVVNSDIDTLVKDVKGETTNFFTNIAREMDDFWNSIPAREQKDLSEFNEWLQKFKNECCLSKKMKLVSEFFVTLIPYNESET